MIGIFAVMIAIGLAIMRFNPKLGYFLPFFIAAAIVAGIGIVAGFFVGPIAGIHHPR